MLDIPSTLFSIYLVTIVCEHICDSYLALLSLSGWLAPLFVLNVFYLPQ